MARIFRLLLTQVAAAFVFLATGFSAQAVTAGPGAWSSNQTWAADAVNGGNLTGYFYWPATPPTLNGKRALILVLHGCAQTAANDVITGSDGGYNWKTSADQYGAVILAPNATGNVSGQHCWDYSRTNHSRTSGHEYVLIDLVNRFKNDAQYAIDPNQVYVAGLSSGGGETLVLGCIAPDIFAGIGINAGPSLGTTTAQIGAVPAGVTAATVGSQCTTLAAGNAAYFSTQIANTVWGTSDFTVAQAYGPLDAAGLRVAYGGSYTKGASFSVAGGGGGIPYTDAAGKLRTTEISVASMAHAWPAGSGGQNTNYVDGTRVDYPVYITAFFFANNLRVSSDPAPTMTSCSASTITATSATINGAASDNGAIASYRVALSGPSAVNDAAAGSGAGFSKAYNLSNGYYTGSVTATDNLGQESAACGIAQFLVGSAPPILPPTGLAAGATSATSVALAWNAVSGASGYNVYRNGLKITAAPVSATAYTSTGLTAATTYNFAVSTVAAAGESMLSPPLSVTTGPAWTCSTTNASNYAHVLAGRAHDSGGYALANGSNQNMGLDNVFFTHTLAQTAAGYYIIGNCP